MSKPDNISQAIWDAATAVVFEIGESEEHDTLPIALALSQAYSRGLEDAARVAERYSIEPDPDDNDPYDDYEMGGRCAARSIEAAIRALGSK